MHLTESQSAFKRITRVCIQQNHTCMHLTESHVYAFNRITLCTHLTESHMYVFIRITSMYLT